MALKAVGSSPTIHPTFLIKKRCYSFRLFIYAQLNTGLSPSGKALDFDSSIRRFKSCQANHVVANFAKFVTTFLLTS